ncbi:MAG: helix-turn-helix transcriptional regulator, partial [Lachnospiraceae bacterium]|nr:helix-turn-helix transcriptional regulator [Lachnospiraceae bacterium]
NFYNACLAKNIKPSAVVQKLGLSGGSVTTWKKRPPSAETLLTLADALDVSVDYLLGREKPEIPEVDPTTKVLIENFNRLSPKDKIDVLNFVLQKAG